MDKIEVGEYVRTKDGIIAKVTDILKEYCIDCDNDVFDLYNGPMMEIPWEYIEEYIVKHSFNIIDLIEIGDVVEVVVAEDFEEEYTEKLEVAAVGITDCKGNKLNEVGICGDDEIEYVSLKDIKTILTHEQYERNCYKAKEK